MKYFHTNQKIFSHQSKFPTYHCQNVFLQQKRLSIHHTAISINVIGFVSILRDKAEWCSKHSLELAYQPRWKLQIFILCHEAWAWSEFVYSHESFSELFPNRYTVLVWKLPVKFIVTVALLLFFFHMFEEKEKYVRVTALYFYPHFHSVLLRKLKALIRQHLLE